MPKVVTQRCLEQDLNPRPTDRKPKCLTRCTTAPPHVTVNQPESGYRQQVNDSRSLVMDTEGSYCLPFPRRTATFLSTLSPRNRQTRPRYYQVGVRWSRSAAGRSVRQVNCRARLRTRWRRRRQLPVLLVGSMSVRASAECAVSDQIPRHPIYRVTHSAAMQRPRQQQQQQQQQQQSTINLKCLSASRKLLTRMWANAQRDGRPM